MQFLYLDSALASGSESDSEYGIGTFLLLAGLAFLYFLPAFLGQKKRNATAITLLNIFLGWTFLGWIVALVWATANDAPSMIVKTVAAPVAVPVLSLADELTKLQHLRDIGTITADEFEVQKQRLLT